MFVAHVKRKCKIDQRNRVFPKKLGFFARFLHLRCIVFFDKPQQITVLKLNHTKLMGLVHLFIALSFTVVQPNLAFFPPD